MSHSHVPAAPAADRYTYIRIDGEDLAYLGWVTDPPATNAPYYTFGPVDGLSACDHRVEMQFRDGDETWCPICSFDHHHSRLRRKITQAPHAAQVWHDFYSPATGRVETDRKKFTQRGKAHVDAVSEELGIDHSFERTDASDLMANINGADRSLTGRRGQSKADQAAEALATTHDVAVAQGRKESKGTFVHTVSE